MFVIIVSFFNVIIRIIIRVIILVIIQWAYYENSVLLRGFNQYPITTADVASIMSMMYPQTFANSKQNGFIWELFKKDVLQNNYKLLNSVFA